MNCEQIEERLPAYAAGELSQDDSATVQQHIAECALCAESFVIYQQLEQSLLARRELRPSSRAAARLASRQVGFRRSREVLRGLCSWPAMASVSFIAFGVALLFRSDLLKGLSGGLQVGFPTRLSAWLQALANAASTVEAGNEFTLLAVHLSVVALIMAAGSWMVLRYVRE
jgi:anti-sigma factor RsiW